MSDEKNGKPPVEADVPETEKVDVPPQGFMSPNHDNDYYVDVCELRGCLYGFDINLGRRSIAPSEPTSKMNAPQHTDVTIKMSPAHFKDMACLMMAQIHAYETQFGKIEAQHVILGVNIEQKNPGGIPPMMPGTPSVLN